MKYFLGLLLLPMPIFAQAVIVEKYDNGSSQTGYRYQMDVGIKDATSSQLNSMPLNPYVSIAWQSVGANMWKGSEPGINCDAWRLNGDIGITCFSSDPF